ncbi:MAG TPA: transglycosylase family protein [Solirubrobacterales bacterium]|nr:transglycosylase family protein [Solirubrobacterales bacterium]
MLTKNTYSLVIALILLALPTAALAAGEDVAEPRIAIGAAVPVGGVLVTDHAESLRREMRAAARRIRVQRRARIRREEREAFATLPAGVSIETLEAIAACESGGDPTALSSDGSYRGKYQFSFETWAAVGGSGDPAAASEAEQDYRAALLYAQAGSSPWPVCGQ